MTALTQALRAHTLVLVTHLDETPTPEQHFGAAVREAREVRGWTQEELRAHLAERGVRLEKTAMIRLEQGRRPIRLNEVAALAKLLGLDLQHYTGTVPQLTAEEYEQAKRSLAEAIEHQERTRHEVQRRRHQLEDEVQQAERDLRYLAEKRWKLEASIGEYEARNGE
ncbi:helix-turn-helix transcriptional regulator [Actinoplanes sp. NPDC023801]|uniref:helix-turn-helix domain-containing protein n=1 Tax=Actinoplanes sp. NPDC023801 TaxID=3154595 RepID=UPI0033FBA455